MRRGLSRSWPLAMMICVVTVLQVFPAKEVDADLTSGAELTEGSISKHPSFRLFRHKFSGHMRVVCQDRLVEPPIVTVSGKIKDGRVSGIFVIDTHGWVPTSVFDIGLNAFDRVHSNFNTQVFSASSIDRLFARMAWLDGEVNLNRIRLTTGFRFLDASIKNINGKIELPDDPKITICKASNFFHLKAM